MSTLWLPVWDARAWQARRAGFCCWVCMREGRDCGKWVFLTKSFSSLWVLASTLPFSSILDVNPALNTH